MRALVVSAMRYMFGFEGAAGAGGEGARRGELDGMLKPFVAVFLALLDDKDLVRVLFIVLPGGLGR